MEYNFDPQETVNRLRTVYNKKKAGLLIKTARPTIVCVITITHDFTAAEKVQLTSLS